jgi:DNA-directed RNA polymerase subunit M/transcription elongation factor TFIIS
MKMETVDQAGEWRRLEELYRSKSDGELEVIAAEADDLTAIAKDVLQREIASRGLKLDVAVPEEPPVEPESTGDVAYDPSQMELLVAHVVWDKESALRDKQILDNAGVPSFFGPDNVELVDDYRSDWSSGVELKIEVDLQQRAAAAMYQAKRNDPSDPSEGPEPPESDYRCPKCHSDGVIFEELEKDSPKDSNFKAKYHWVCDDCGYEWVDDGIEK